MIKPMDVTPEISEALAVLRVHTKYGSVAQSLKDAINTLDNAGVFAEIDERRDYASAEEILAEAARADTAPLDPAEWGDTTRADLARRSALFMAPPKERPNAL